jgi:uncharacterized protein (TIGR02466 family)
MRVNNIFSVGVGIEPASEMLPLARKIFVDNSTKFLPATQNPGLLTTLSSYFKNASVNHTKNEDTDMLEQFILEQARKYIEFCGYKAKDYKYEITMWLNEMKSDAVHKLHHHYGYTVSGCFYVDLPKNSNIITFSHPHLNTNSFGQLAVNDYTPYCSSTWSFNPREGELYFWKSDLFHEVPAMVFDGVRRTIAFDICVTGATGKN